MDLMDQIKVITVVIHDAFLQGDWPQDKHPGYIMFEGFMIDMICEINPLFRDRVIWGKDGKKKFLYDQLIKAVYGTLLGVIISYNKLTK